GRAGAARGAPGRHVARLRARGSPDALAGRCGAAGADKQPALGPGRAAGAIDAASLDAEGGELVSDLDRAEDVAQRADGVRASAGDPVGPVALGPETIDEPLEGRVPRLRLAGVDPHDPSAEQIVEQEIPLALAVE